MTASGFTHDDALPAPGAAVTLVHTINNIITPVALETEALLADAQLSERMRAYAESVSLALGEIGAAVGGADPRRAPGEKPPVQPPRKQGRLRSLRILLVDDDPFVLDSLGTVLQLSGHNVTPADSGAAGIAAVREAHLGGKPFEVVITDFAMPGMDGRTAARTMKAIRAATQVILLTGWGRRRIDREVDAEIDFILSKPPQISELNEALAYCASRIKWDALDDAAAG